MSQDKNYLLISEKFYSIQGEGQTIGTPSIFIRLGGCNLLCKSDSWTCDSIEVWKKSKKVDFEFVLEPEEIIGLKHGVHLVFTGGEPMLHQKSIENFLVYLSRNHKLNPTVEIETNGTITPNHILRAIVKFWNVSPKLSNSGELKEKRFDESSLKSFSFCKGKVMFKFVISKREDVEEIFTDFGDIVSREQVYLMPAADNATDLSKKRLEVIEFCKQYFLKFTDRLHITTWNKKTGV